MVTDLMGENALLRQVKDTIRQNYLKHDIQPSGPKRLVVDPESPFDARTDPMPRSRAGWAVASR